jgi:hypothetical protein
VSRHVFQREKLAATCAYWLVLALFLAAPIPLRAQSDTETENHRWIVLLDVSASFAQGDDENQLVGEVLRLLHTFLGVQSETSVRPRTDQLNFYVFGGQVRPVAIPEEPVTLTSIHDETWWSGHLRVDRQMAAHTRLDGALQQAADTFRSQPEQSIKHLILISDGELDVPSEVRRSGQAPAPEEITAYTALFGGDNSPLLDLQDLAVDAYILLIDPTVVDADAHRITLEGELQAFPGSSPRERIMARIQSPTGSAGEGPSVMLTIAQILNGRLNTVGAGNLLDVVRSAVFPGLETRRFAPRGTYLQVAFLPRSSPIRVDLEQTEVSPAQSAILTYDENEPDAYQEEYLGDLPPSERRPLNVRAFASRRFVTWLIASPELSGATTEENPIMSAFKQNVYLRWVAEKPPAVVSVDDAVPIQLAVRWYPSGGEKLQARTLSWWREHLVTELESGDLEATARITPATGGESVEVPLHPHPREDENFVLGLNGEFTPVSVGQFKIKARIAYGRGDRRTSIPSDFRHLQIRSGPQAHGAQPELTLRVFPADGQSDSAIVPASAPGEAAEELPFLPDQLETMRVAVCSSSPEDLPKFSLRLSQLQITFQDTDNQVQMGVPGDKAGDCTWVSPPIEVRWFGAGAQRVVLRDEQQAVIAYYTLRPRVETYWEIVKGFLIDMLPWFGMVVILGFGGLAIHYCFFRRDVSLCRDAVFQYRVVVGDDLITPPPGSPNKIIVWRENGAVHVAFRHYLPCSLSKRDWVEFKAIGRGTRILTSRFSNTWRCGLRRSDEDGAPGPIDWQNLGDDGCNLNANDLAYLHSIELRHRDGGAARIQR